MTKTKRLITTLTLIFILQKLLGISTWPWVWVICPVWGYWVGCCVIDIYRAVDKYCKDDTGLNLKKWLKRKPEEEIKGYELEGIARRD